MDRKKKSNTVRKKKLTKKVIKDKQTNREELHCKSDRCSKWTGKRGQTQKGRKKCLEKER